MIRFMVVASLLLGAVVAIFSPGDGEQAAGWAQERTISAPRDKVFDALRAESNYDGMRLVSNTGLYKRYELQLERNVIQAMAAQGNRQLSDTFLDGTMVAILKPDDAMSIMLKSKNEDVTLSFDMTFTDGPSGYDTRVSTSVSVKDEDLTDEQRASMQTMMTALSGKMVENMFTQFNMVVK